MMQLRDPMYADQTGNMIAQAGGDISQRLMQLPGLLRENETWKRNEAGFKSKQEFKKKMFDSVQNDLRKIGVDPSTVQLPDPNDPNEDPADFGAKMGGVIYPHFVGAGSKLSAEDAAKLGIAANPNVQEAVSKQKFLDQSDPMGQINLNGMAGTPAPAGAPVENANQQVDPMLQDVLGATPQANTVQPKEDNNYFDPLAQQLVKEVRSGAVSADKAFERASRIKELEIKERLEDKRAEREERKRQNELHAAGVYGAGDTNEIVDPKTGEPAVVTRENVMDVGIGQRKYPPKSGRGSGSGSENEDTLKQQKEAWDQYNDVERQRLSMVKGRDENGMAVPFDPESYAQKTNESVIRLLAYDLTASGVDLGASNAAAIKTVDAPMAIMTQKASDPVVDVGGGQWALNMANKKIRSALLEASKNGIPASQILLEIRRAKGLNPARQW